MDSMPELLQQLGAIDEEVRRSAVVRLQRHPFGEVREHLYRALGDESWRVRKEACEAILATLPDAGTVEEVIALLRSGDNAGLRNSAVEILERLGERAVPSLCEHVGDADQDVRKFVIDILGAIGSRSAVPHLIAALGDPDPNVSAAAIETLGKIGDVQVVPHLLQVLSANEPLLVFTVLEALAKIGAPVPLADLVPLAGQNLVRKPLYECLGAIGGAEAAPLLLEGLAGRARNAREAAALALVRLRGRLPGDQIAAAIDAPLRELAGSPAVEGLLASFDTADGAVKEALITLLGIIGESRAVGRLLRECRNERLARVCFQAFREMGQAGATALIEAYREAEEEERCIILHLCAELGLMESAPLARAALRESFPLLRRVAARAVGAIGLASLVDDVAPLLDDRDPEVREAARGALAALAQQNRERVAAVARLRAGAEDAAKRRDAALLYGALGDAERLSLLIKDESSQVRATAVKIVAGLGSAAAAGQLIMALVDEEPDVRIAAAGALGEIGGAAGAKALGHALQDENPWVCCAALRSLGKRRSAEAVPTIVDLLGRADTLVLITALETLAEIGGDEAFARIRSVLDHADEEVVKVAIDLLQRDGDGWLDEMRDRLLAHPSWAVRSSFIRAYAGQRGAAAVPPLRAALERETDELVRSQINDIVDRWQ